MCGLCGSEFTSSADWGDVFSPNLQDFFGNQYAPLASVRDSTVTDLVHYLWTHRENRGALRLSAVKTSAVYDALEARFEDWTNLLDEAIKDLIAALQTYKSHNYTCIGGRIGYKVCYC